MPGVELAVDGGAAVERANAIAREEARVVREVRQLGVDERCDADAGLKATGARGVDLRGAGGVRAVLDPEDRAISSNIERAWRPQPRNLPS